MSKNNQNLKKSLRKQLDIDRYYAVRLGEEALRIIQNGYYLLSGGTRVEIRQQVQNSVLGTVSYPPEKPLPEKTFGNQNTIIEIHNCTTLTAVQMLIFRGTNPVALNFASATEPGGAFLRGARAQEEYLARSSSLFACLQNNPMYAYHQSQMDPFYSDYVIYSPNVVVFRDENGELFQKLLPSISRQLDCFYFFRKYLLLSLLWFCVFDNNFFRTGSNTMQGWPRSVCMNM